MDGQGARSRPIGAARWCKRALLLGVAVASGSFATHHATAFPLSDVTSPSIVPPATGAEPDAADAAALAHQIQLLGGYSQNVGTGWNITPSLGLQETFNDNVLESSSNRQWDLISSVTPGLAIYGDTPNTQVRLNYQPSLLYYARESSLNQIAQQLNAVGNFTLWQDHVYLDVRGLAGIGSANGNAPGLGYGTNGSGGQGTSTAILNKQNSTQFTSFEASPYFLQSFGDYGTLKVGYTINQSSQYSSGGVTSVNGTNSNTSSTQISNEELVQYTTGQYFDRIFNTTAADATQFSGTGGSSAGHHSTVTDTLNYVLNRTYTVLGTIGYEDIDYGSGSAVAIHDLTWSIGTTITPDPLSSITVTYGHQDGVNNLSFNGRYALTARTAIFASYQTELGTQLQAVQSQLESSTVSNNGSLVNSQTGAPTFVGNNLLGTQTQVYRSQTLSVGTSTLLDRDTIAINAQFSDYTLLGSGSAGQDSSGITGTLSWIHQLSEDLTLSSSASYGRRWSSPGGQSLYFAGTGALTYNISTTLSSSLSYSLYDVNASGALGESMYQDLVILSLNKQF
jgi:uncharacterized protein (PEP-CTERM system associated)